MHAVYGSNRNIGAFVVPFVKAHPTRWFGAYFVGVAVDFFFFGLLCCQVWSYHSSFPNDSRWNKTLVAICFCLSLVKAFESFWGVWMGNVAAFGDWQQAATTEWPVIMEPTTMAILAATAQIYFTWRCFVLTGRNWLLLVLLGAVMLSTVALGIAFSIQLAYNPLDLPMIQRIVVPMLVLGVLVDIVITLTVLRKISSSRQGIRKIKNNFLNQWITVTCQCALPPTLSQVVNLVVFIMERRRSVWYALFNMTTPRLYVFSLMFALNSRIQIRPLPQNEVHMVSQVPYTERSALSAPVRTGRRAAIATLSDFQANYRPSVFETSELPPPRNVQTNSGEV